ncbi:hypothetical protein GS534_24475 [Rhodococcus hoagii]|nr:hypothetical protein [Prescottella equi]NKS33186.1 hypothetical protein [Prescottella equi]
MTWLPLILTYAVIVLVVWPGFAKATLRWGAPFPERHDAGDYWCAAVISLLGALVWPVILLVWGITYIVSQPLRQYLFEEKK